LRKAGILDAKGDWAGGSTLMIVVGDSIDKGRKSWEVLNLWMRLTPEAAAAHGRLVVLLGNHEDELLASPGSGETHKKSDETAHSLSDHGMSIEQLDDPANPMGRFVQSMPVAARVGKFLFCHAGWLPAPVGSTPSSRWAAFADLTRATLDGGRYGDPVIAADDGILEKKSASFEPVSDGDAKAKKWWKSKGDVAALLQRLDSYGLAGVVFGHQPDAFGTAGDIGPYSRQGESDFRLIKIDSGMAPLDAADDVPAPGGGQPYPGHLLEFRKPTALLITPAPGAPISGAYDDGFDPGPDGFVYASHPLGG
jgi:hypothetical protein